MTRYFLPLLLIICAGFAGCKRRDIRVYHAPVDETPENSTTAASSTTPEPAAGIAWKLPAGWKETGGDKANLARFQTPDGGEVAVTALTSMEGKEATLVNMYRQMRGLTTLGDAEAAAELKRVPVAGANGWLLDVQDSGNPEMQFLVAFVHHGEESVFFKIQGSQAVVTNQRPAFLEFLQSVRLDSPKPAAKAAHTHGEKPAAESGAAPKLNLPEGWKQVEPGPMQVAKFTLERDGGKADVTVSVFPNDTGGALSNVKRWRGQIGLPDAEDAEVMKATSPFPGSEKDGLLVHLENGERMLIGAILPKEGQWLFFKMMGDSKAVGASKEQFVAFIQGLL